MPQNFPSLSNVMRKGQHYETGESQCVNIPWQLHATDQTNKLDALHLCKWMGNSMCYVTWSSVYYGVQFNNSPYT